MTNKIGHGHKENPSNLFLKQQQMLLLKLPIDIISFTFDNISG